MRGTEDNFTGIPMHLLRQSPVHTWHTQITRAAVHA